MDARGMRCPWPAIRAARAVRMHADDVVEVLADDPAAERELRALANTQGRRFEIHEDGGNARYRLHP